MNICSAKRKNQAYQSNTSFSIKFFMATIIVITDFSQSARNALNYACAFFAASDKIELLLVNINSVPSSYSGDGVSMAAISDTLGNRVQKLRDAVEDVAENFPAAKIKYRALIGNYIKSLQELIEEQQAGLVVVGTPAAYGEIWRWDVDTLRALTELPIPVLAVPRDVVYKPVAQVSFASIPGNLHSASPIESIKKLIKYTGAKLHVVSVVGQQHDEQKEKQAEEALHKQLEEVNTEYHKIEGTHIVQAIGKFVEEQHIDLLVVRPRKHGIWYNLFHKSYARELAKLNLIPVMALHDEWNVD
jgi:nucleotide-binding universal stress UspA family protein